MALIWYSVAVLLPWSTQVFRNIALLWRPGASLSLLLFIFIYFSFSRLVCPCPPSSCVARSPPLSVLPSFSPPPSFTASKSSGKSELSETKRSVSLFFQDVRARPVHVHGLLHHFGQRRPLCRSCHQRLLSSWRKVSSLWDRAEVSL